MQEEIGCGEHRDVLPPRHDADRLLGKATTKDGQDGMRATAARRQQGREYAGP